MLPCATASLQARQCCPPIGYLSPQQTCQGADPGNQVRPVDRGNSAAVSAAQLSRYSCSSPCLICGLLGIQCKASDDRRCRVPGLAGSGTSRIAECEFGFVVAVAGKLPGYLTCSCKDYVVYSCIVLITHPLYFSCI